MSGMNPPAAGNPAPSPADPALGGPGSQPGAPVDLVKLQADLVAAQTSAGEWQRRFNGLQGRFGQEQEALSKANAKVMDLDTIVKTITGEREALALEVEKANKTATEAAAQAATAAAGLARTNLIATKFPQLMDFERDHLLPAGSGDALEPLLTAFAAKLGTVGTTNTAKVGETPPAPGSVPATKAVLMSQMLEARSKGAEGNAEYEALHAQLVKLEPQNASLNPQGGIS